MFVFCHRISIDIMYHFTYYENAAKIDAKTIVRMFKTLTPEELVADISVSAIHDHQLGVAQVVNDLLRALRGHSCKNRRSGVNPVKTFHA